MRRVLRITLAVATALLVIFDAHAHAGGPRIDSPAGAPGGFVFQGDPDSVEVYRDTLHVATIRPDSPPDTWIPLGDGDVLVTFNDPMVWKLAYNTYEYWVRGHWGALTHSPYPQKTKHPQPEAVLITSRKEICLQRAGYNRCQVRER